MIWTRNHKQLVNHKHLCDLDSQGGPPRVPADPRVFGTVSHSVNNFMSNLGLHDGGGLHGIFGGGSPWGQVLQRKSGGKIRLLKLSGVGVNCNLEIPLFL